MVALVTTALFFVYRVPVTRHNTTSKTTNRQVDVLTRNTGGSSNGNTDGGSTGAGSFSGFKTQPVKAVFLVFNRRWIVLVA